MRHTLRLLLCLFICGAVNAALAGTIAYQVPAGTAGNQDFGGALGMDFETTTPVDITQLGVFDSNSDGLANPIFYRLYDRTRAGLNVPIANFTFAGGSSAPLVGGSRMLALGRSIYLPAGFQGRVVASGYSAAELNGNSGGAPPVWATNSGGGALTFSSGGFYGFGAGDYPTNGDGGPANRYAAGTFEYQNSVQTVSAPTIDLTTQGNWIGKYGADGYILPAFDLPTGGFDPGRAGDRVSLPSYVSSYAFPNGFNYSWSSDTDGDVRTLQEPGAPSQRRATTAFQGGEFDAVIEVNQPVDFQVAVYLLDYDSTVRDQVTHVGGRAFVDDTTGPFNPGKWQVYNVSAAPGAPLVFNFTQLGGANVVVSGIMFDPVPVPEPSSCILFGLGALGLLWTRRR